MLIVTEGFELAAVTNSKDYNLAGTARGAAWLSQFAASDADAATRLISNLTLVSHSAFERALTLLIEREAKAIDGLVALFATREMVRGVDYFAPVNPTGEQEEPIDAVARGSDLGSEARVAALIRNLAKATPHKYLNHPSLEMLRTEKCRAIFAIDDFIGSGRRTSKFLASMWQSRTIRSWHSRGSIRFIAVAYSSTDNGSALVQRSRCEPETILYRNCPTFWEMPWAHPLKDGVIALCRKYGAKTSRPNMRLGYDKTMAALVFEHGCPNNAPSVLWAPSEKEAGWQPLFPDRSILPAEASAFPPDVTHPPARAVLNDAGRRRLAGSKALQMRAPIGPNNLILLSLSAIGHRSHSALGYATGLSRHECSLAIDDCIKRGFLTPALRITAAGRAEIKYASTLMESRNRVPPRGGDEYYPKQLRGPIRG